MIAIFTVLGLILFGGGAYAIFDGWPYLVLERGFTQVIIGSIASTAGLILLSLAWVLREFRAVRRALQEDAEARIAMQPFTPAPVDTAFEPPRPAPVSSLSPVLVPAAVGAAAVGAVADALSASPREEAPAVPPPAPATDRDLFGDLVKSLRTPETTVEEPVDEHAPEAQPLPDMFSGASAERYDESEEPLIAVATESHEPVEVVAAKIQPMGEDEALAHADDLAHADKETHLGEDTPVGEEASAEEPVPGAEEAEEKVEERAGTDAEAEAEPAVGAPQPQALAPVEPVDDLDEFSALRASLTGHLRQNGSDDTRVEPSLEPESDPFAVAEAWMDRASPRKEPWFETPPPANEPQAAETDSPPWPPRTEAHAFAEPAAPAAAEPHEALPSAEPEQPEVVEEAVQPAAIEGAAEPEAEAPEGPAPVSEPAASEEGVVGAYQVGDAHFTIYADGSIRARTPDGEYSFSSMDELKVYLASEKSRLGV